MKIQSAKKKSLAHWLRASLSWIILCAAILNPVQSVHADAAPPPDPDLGGVAPYQPIETKVQMLSENVSIDLPPPDPASPAGESYQEKLHVRASFSMRNQGSAEESMQVVFPLTRMDYPWQSSSYDIVFDSFAAKVNGEPGTITRISTPPEMAYAPKQNDSVMPPDGKYFQDVQWAAFEAEFLPGQDVELEVEYDMLGYGFTGVEYILESGAGWYGKIGSADITVHFPFPLEEDAIYQANPGYRISGNELRWSLKDFEPTRKDNLFVWMVDTHAWEKILEERTELQQNPDDAEAWFRLGIKYSQSATWFMAAECNQLISYQFRSESLAALAVKAFQKAAEIRPTWGDAHMEAAYYLWYGNPAVKKKMDQGPVNFTPMSANDELVQQVLGELRLAWSDGTSLTWDECNLVASMNRLVPSLQLVMPPTSTPIPFPPTPTDTYIIPSLTATTVSDTLTPFPAPTTEPKKGASSLVIGGLVTVSIILIGGLIFLWQPYHGRKL